MPTVNDHLGHAADVHETAGETFDGCWIVLRERRSDGSDQTLESAELSVGRVTSYEIFHPETAHTVRQVRHRCPTAGSSEGSNLRGLRRSNGYSSRPKEQQCAVSIR
jgi:hypothetical protein